MTRWKKVLVAASTGATLVVMATVAASASGTGRSALRMAGAHVALAANTPASSAKPGGVASGPGLGPIQISVGDRWTLQGQLIVKGSLTITCGPFLPNTEFSSGADITVEEALGDHVGHAQGSIQSLTCDGARHAYPITALVSDVPFRAADGAASASARACGQDPSSFQFICQNGAAITPITVK
jgi:hypothetical protein